MKMSIIRKPLWSLAAIHKVMPVGILCTMCSSFSGMHREEVFWEVYLMGAQKNKEKRVFVSGLPPHTSRDSVAEALKMSNNNKVMPVGIIMCSSFTGMNALTGVLCSLTPHSLTDNWHSSRNTSDSTCSRHC